MLNITTFLDANARRLDKQVFHCPERNISYTSQEILAICSEIARALLASGINKGDRVMLYMNSTPEYLFSYFAVWRIGAIAVPTNRVYTESELQYMLTDSGAKVIITDFEGAKIARNLNVIIYVPENIEAFRKTEVLPPAKTEFNDVCQLQYTSGTTGRPKGAMLTHGNWFTAIHNECDVLALNQNDVYLGIYPMGHVGLSWGIAAMRSGALYVMMERYEPEAYLAHCETYKVNVLAGMPPVIHYLCEAPEGTEKRLETVREIISGGGPLHNGIWKNFYERYSIPIVNAYGLSETVVIGTGTVIRPVDYSTADRFESVGHPVCFSEVKIVDEGDSSREMPTGISGEIALRGPAVALGYWNMPEETKEAFLESGWFLTGDVGYLDQDNRLCITDRKKDMIVMSGWKIYPTEVEDALLKYSKVAEVAIFGIPHEHRGEIPVAAVVWKEEADESGLLSFAKEHLAGYKIPRKIISVDALPRVNGWKLLRRELREKYS